MPDRGAHYVLCRAIYVFVCVLWKEKVGVISWSHTYMRVL